MFKGVPWGRGGMCVHNTCMKEGFNSSLSRVPICVIAEMSGREALTQIKRGYLKNLSESK